MRRVTTIDLLTDDIIKKINEINDTRTQTIVIVQNSVKIMTQDQIF